MHSPARIAASTARFSSLLLTLVAAVLAAQLTWQVLSPREPVALTPVALAVLEPSPAASPPAPGLQRLASAALFGSVESANTPVPTTAPDTRLNLRLLGILADTDGSSPSGFAIIAEGGQPERLLTVGDRVGNSGALLHAIHADRVLLDRNGRLETLRFPETPGGRTATPGPVSNTLDRPAPAPTSPGPMARRSQWLENPERLLSAVQARPVMRDGQLYGLLLESRQNSREFQQAGLETGDILTSVNGMTIGSIESADELLQELARADQVQLTVERDGETRALSVRLLD